MPTGRVRWFDAAKGYGFITSEEGKDVFLPAQAVTVTHLLPTAKSWPRCCVRWRINSMYRTDLIYD